MKGWEERWNLKNLRNKAKIQKEQVRKRGVGVVRATQKARRSENWESYLVKEGEGRSWKTWKRGKRRIRTEQGMKQTRIKTLEYQGEREKKAERGGDRGKGKETG